VISPLGLYKNQDAKSGVWIEKSSVDTENPRKFGANVLECNNKF